MADTAYFAHDTAVIDDGAEIGEGSKIWHFSHVMPTAKLGRRCIVGQGCYIGRAVIGDGVKIQNNVSVYDGVVLEDDVFCGPSCVFTNVMTPRAAIEKKDQYLETRVCARASIGANATIVCGVTIGRYAFIGAGAVVRQDVPAHALMVGVPARQIGWACQCGETLSDALSCQHCGKHFRQTADGIELAPAPT